MLCPWWLSRTFALRVGTTRRRVFEFEWGPAKAASNLRKHGVSFEEAATVLADNLLLSMLDNEHGGFEERWVSLGRSSEGQVLALVHTYLQRDDATVVRIISARPATPRERRRYAMRP